VPGDVSSTLGCAVIGVPDTEWGERVIAFVAPRIGSVDVTSIERHCRAVERSRRSASQCSDLLQ